MRIGLILSEVGQGFRRNLSMVVSVVLVTFISLTFFGAAILLQFQIGEMKGYWYDRAQVVVYFCTDISLDPDCAETAATDEQVAAVQAQLEGPTLAPFIKETTFETQQEAYDEVRHRVRRLAARRTDDPGHLQPGDLGQHEGSGAAPTSSSTASPRPAGVEEVKDQRGVPRPDLLDHEHGERHGGRGRRADAHRGRAADRDHHPAERVLATAGDRDHATGRRVEPLHRDAVHPRGRASPRSSARCSPAVAIVAIVQFFVQGYLIDTISSAGRIIDAGDALLVVPILLAVGAVLAALSAGVAIRRYLKV